MRGEDEPAELPGVGGRVDVSGALRLLDELSAGGEQPVVGRERPGRNGLVLPGQLGRGFGQQAAQTVSVIRRRPEPVADTVERPVLGAIQKVCGAPFGLCAVLLEDPPEQRVLGCAPTVMRDPVKAAGYRYGLTAAPRSPRLRGDSRA